ncbi:MAG: hypothetical protein U1F43_36840 [Myxococcota bacterium]
MAAAGALAVAAVAWRWALPVGRAIPLVALGALGHALGHVPMPLVGYGGSAIVAVCLGFALAVARPDGWTAESRLG